jgi:hypothetical protein
MVPCWLTGCEKISGRVGGQLSPTGGHEIATTGFSAWRGCWRHVGREVGGVCCCGARMPSSWLGRCWSPMLGMGHRRDQGPFTPSWACPLWTGWSQSSPNTSRWSPITPDVWGQQTLAKTANTGKNSRITVDQPDPRWPAAKLATRYSAPVSARPGSRYLRTGHIHRSQWPAGSRIR